jgi:Pentapeptide repeats (8 copies)
MASAPWWWVPLITLIGTPFLGALLYFFVPLIGVAKRLGIWLSNPPWWVQNIFAALLVGGIVAVVSIKWQERISDVSATQATRLENLRFVRQLSSENNATRPFPFAHLDLQGQDLDSLDLKAANLRDANLHEAHLDFADLSAVPGTQATEVPQPTALTRADLSGANLTGAWLLGANLTAANLFTANLTGALLDEANLTGANVTVANLTHAHLTSANLTRADLSFADLSFANLRSADLHFADLSDADLTRANLTDATLVGATLTDTTLDGANLTGVRCDKDTKWPIGFSPPRCG